ncbi:MAG: major capsid protein [Thermodesulfovibrionia bacterium]|nr:major capsid protein [Thermodesulfovibrionia bacterium]
MFVNLAKDPAFNVASLSQAINILPNNYGKVREMNLFPFKGVRTRVIYVEEQNGVLNLLQTQPIGAPGDAGISGKRKVRSFVIPHIPHDDVVLPEEVEGVRAFGAEQDVLKTIADAVNEKLQSMKNKHSITLEHLRMGALKGIILDADGSTLYNLYTEFEIEAKEIDFVLGTATTKVINKCNELARHLEKNLKGEVMNGIHAFVSPEFFDKLTNHATVKEAYARWQNGEALRSDMRKGFRFGPIMFEEYIGEATDKAGNVRKFITAEEGHAFPTGTNDTFKTFCAPADFNETVNTIGQPIYAKISERKHGRGYDLHTQSNPLPLCARPGVLVKVKSSN